MVPVAASIRDALQAAQGQGRRARGAKPTKGQSDLKETRFLQKCPEINLVASKFGSPLPA